MHKLINISWNNHQQRWLLCKSVVKWGTCQVTILDQPLFLKVIIMMQLLCQQQQKSNFIESQPQAYEIHKIKIYHIFHL